MSARPGVAQSSHQLARSRADLRWQDDALCAEVPAEYFPNQGDMYSALQAKRVCGLCRVRPECLEHALQQGEWSGVWGGKSVDERREIVRRRREQRNRKRVSP